MRNVTYINAGAGSGKTYRLTEILTDLIKRGEVKPEEVILTTFTRKAANEFKEKAKAALFKEGMYDEAVQLDQAMIGTVHSVCQRLVGKYWFILGLSPDMGVMAEEDTAYYISQSLAELPTDAELEVLHRFAREFDIREVEDYKPKAAIDFNIWQQHLKEIIGYATNYELPNFVDSERESLEFIKGFVKSGVSISITDKELDAAQMEARSFVQSSNRIKKKDDYYKSFDEVDNGRGDKTIAWYKQVHNILKEKYGATCAVIEERTAGIWSSQEVYKLEEEYIKLLFELAQRWRKNYAQFKIEKNLMDYNDMEKYMLRLMQDKSIASEIGEAYHYLFVDEFQDSSPIQVKIFDALSDLMKHSYWVGDYKQAIYGFRGSDVALTKAVVDRVERKENGCDTDTLKQSWRSLPDIVDVNNAVFEKTFANVLDYKNIHLDKVRENEDNVDSLRYFVTEKDGPGVAEHVLKLINEGAKPNEIAVLARLNSALNKLASEMNALNIPSSREDAPVKESATYTLMAALLRIVASSKDALSKATVAYLTEQDYDTRRVIERRIEQEGEEYLSDVPLVSQLLRIRPQLMQQSVASLVESVTIELNLYDVVKRVEEDSAFGMACLQTIINTARAYEEHCVQMNLPASIDGFLSYVNNVKMVCSGDPDGVQLLTYHSSKGLQWKYVIMMSLGDDVKDVKKAIKREMFGVKAVHKTEPTATNPYPDVYIRLTPWIYGTGWQVKAPDEICAKIEDTEVFKSAYNSMLAEANRVFYVGMTRARDVLLLQITGDNPLRWAKDNGVVGAGLENPAADGWDVFGTGHKFKDYTVEGDVQPYANGARLMALNASEPTFKEREPRYLSPSGMRQKGEIGETLRIGKRIPLSGAEDEEMAVVGNCVHQIFAWIDEKPLKEDAYRIEMDEIIGKYGLKGKLTDKNAIKEAWRNLVKYLTEHYGAAERVYHERPFRMEREGQTIVGSMDLVWQTREGDVLVDFKTCPNEKVAFDEESEHYVGWYAGQLNAYTEALKTAGESVIARYIYYPVIGILVGM